jgi:Uma2 family endonuclease
MAIAQRRMTLEEFLRLPEEEPALEYEDGMVTQKVAPKGRHSALQSGWVKLIDGYAVPRRLARAFPELRAGFAGASPVPDVSVYAGSASPATRAGG